MSQPKIVTIGHVCIDHNISEHARYVDWGSGALYMSSYAQNQLGLAPVILTTYGSDLLPYVQDFRLQPAQPQADKTLIYENVTKHDKRVQRCHSASIALPPALDEAAKRLLHDADIVVLATLLPNYPVPYVRELLSYTRKDCLKVCCPQGYFRQVRADGSIGPRDFSEASELLPLFGLTLLSEEDHPTARELAVRWKQQPDMSEIVVTEGSRGASIAIPDGLRNIPTMPIAEEDVVDSVGSGDVFAMATAYDFYKSHNLEQAIFAGHQAARAKLLHTPTELTHPQPAR